jgi:hypothetical protein
MSAVLAYVPFLDPLPGVNQWWYLLLIPLALGISITYKAVRLPTLASFWRHVAVMTTQIVLAMIALAVFMVVLVQVLIPLTPAE